MTKRAVLVFLLFFCLIYFTIPFISAGFSEWYNKITGKASTTQSVLVNISIAGGNAPIIKFVFNETINVATGPTEATATTEIGFNFTVYDADGVANLNDSSALGNFSLGTVVRQNSTCSKAQSSGTYTNYTCNIRLMWWDGTGSWKITTFIQDLNNNVDQNTTTTFFLGTTTGFISNPRVTFGTVAPGAKNSTATNTILMNNTGNVAISNGNIQINATNLLGELDNTKGLYAANFSVFSSQGGTPPVECNGTRPVRSVYTGLVGLNLSTGNYTINDNSTGQEQLFFCLFEAGNELSSQPYSTLGEGTWTLKVV